jgi:hypothetical protein
VPIVGWVGVPIVGCVGVPIVGRVGVPMVGKIDVPMVDPPDIPGTVVPPIVMVDPIVGNVAVPMADVPLIASDETMLGNRKPSVGNATRVGNVEALAPTGGAPTPAVDDRLEIPGVVVSSRRGSVDAFAPEALFAWPRDPGVDPA